MDKKRERTNDVDEKVVDGDVQPPPSKKVKRTEDEKDDMDTDTDKTILRLQFNPRQKTTKKNAEQHINLLMSAINDRIHLLPNNCHLKICGNCKLLDFNYDSGTYAELDEDQCINCSTPCEGCDEYHYDDEGDYCYECLDKPQCEKCERPIIDFDDDILCESCYIECYTPKATNKQGCK